MGDEFQVRVQAGDGIQHLFDDLDIDIRPFGIGVAGSRRQGRQVEVDEGVADLEDGNARRMPGDLPIIGHFELGLYFDDQFFHWFFRPLGLVTDM